MREMTVALGLVEQGDHYLLQLRGDNPMIGGAGLIGCFGGKLENGEEPLGAMGRELAEETTYQAVETEFKKLGTVEVTSDHMMETVKVLGHVFWLLIPEESSFEAKEGELIRLGKTDVASCLDKMTTGTRACFEQYILQGGKDGGSS